MHHFSFLWLDGVALVAFGGGVGPIYLGEVECTGTEVGLGDCSRTTFPGFCSHFKDAGVTCYEGETHIA